MPTPKPLTNALPLHWPHHAEAPHMQAEVYPRFANAPQLRLCGVEDVLAGGPCYGAEKVRALAAALPEKVTVLQAVDALRGKIPDADLLWLATLPCWYERPDVVLRWLAADFAAMALPHYEATEQGKGPRNCIMAVRRLALEQIAWESGERSAAEGAARSAAWSAARSAAESAALNRLLLIVQGGGQ